MFAQLQAHQALRLPAPKVNSLTEETFMTQSTAISAPRVTAAKLTLQAQTAESQPVQRIVTAQMAQKRATFLSALQVPMLLSTTQNLSTTA